MLNNSVLFDELLLSGFEKRKNDVCRMTLNDSDAEKKSRRIEEERRKFLKCMWEGAEYDHMWS